MDKPFLSIDPRREVSRITKFIRTTLKQQGFRNVIIASSGGIDSTTVLYLLVKAVSPKHIFVVHLPYASSLFPRIQKLTSALRIPKMNVLEVSIKSIADEIARRADLVLRSDLDKIRFGNIMARVRMILLYDLAKKHRALVCGTENQSEYHLAYFTRFGDEASDFEPIRHLFKTQVFKLAQYLGVPKEIIDQSPTAGLWPGQTDEDEFGFTYKEADEVLVRYFDKHMTVEQIMKEGFANVKKVIERVKKNDYKHHTPYIIK